MVGFCSVRLVFRFELLHFLVPCSGKILSGSRCCDRCCKEQLSAVWAQSTILTETVTDVLIRSLLLFLFVLCFILGLCFIYKWHMFVSSYFLFFLSFLHQSLLVLNPILFLAHAPLGGRLGSYETERSSDGIQDRLAQWLSPSSTRLHWNTSVSTRNINLLHPEWLVQLNTTVHLDMVGYPAAVCCQRSQVHCVFQRCIWPSVWSCCAQDEGETRCFSTFWITR